MKLRLFSAVLVSALANTMLFAQQKTGYQIDGSINGLKNGDKVVMLLCAPDGSFHFERRDSAIVLNGKFHLSGTVPEGPRFYWMIFPGHPNGANPRDAKVTIFFIDNGERISIQYDGIPIDSIHHDYLDDFLQSSISGSKSQYAMRWLGVGVGGMHFQAIGHMMRSFNRVKDSIGFDAPLVDGLMKAYQDVDMGLYDTYLWNPKDNIIPAIPALALRGENRHLWFWPAVYQGLDEHLKQSCDGQRMKKYLPLCVGQILPGFTLPASDGREMSLQDIVKKSKITLVHFWAKNSVTREEYDAELRAMYKRYHDKGLNIIGVSTDYDTEIWNNTLLTEKYPWYNVIDLLGKKIVDKVYLEHGKVNKENTTNVLLDDQGKILAWDPTGLILQWYLWKTLDGPATGKR